eukprot:6978446-Pyramimonas_sp.AAC.1
MHADRATLHDIENLQAEPSSSICFGKCCLERVFSPRLPSPGLLSCSVVDLSTWPFGPPGGASACVGSPIAGWLERALCFGLDSLGSSPPSSCAVSPLCRYLSTSCCAMQPILKTTLTAPPSCLLLLLLLLQVRGDVYPARHFRALPLISFCAVRGRVRAQCRGMAAARIGVRS